MHYGGWRRLGDAGDHSGSALALEEELELGRGLVDRRGLGIALANSGEAARSAGDVAGAREFYAEALAVLRSSGDRSAIATALVPLGLLDLLDGYLHVGPQFAEALRIWEELGDQHGVSIELDRFALLAEKMGEDILAAKLLGASENIREMTGAAF